MGIVAGIILSPCSIFKPIHIYRDCPDTAFKKTYALYLYTWRIVYTSLLRTYFPDYSVMNFQPIVHMLERWF